ncbi:MAG: hypothetical protein R3272_04270 [Candidatus Promineifilaceae bacterium]|nr:hypothetical protein [Candidatus Promineifilaceae bacterium]
MALEFLRRLFGQGGKESRDSDYQDPQGLYLFVECERCGAQLRLRADKKYDLNRTAEGYTWHKTIIDSQCFQPMPTVVTFDKQFNVISSDIEGGRYITREQFEAEEPPPEMTEASTAPEPSEQEKDRE